jgi:hypothetical protein
MGRLWTLKYATAVLAALSVITPGVQSAEWALAGIVLGPNDLNRTTVILPYWCGRLKPELRRTQDSIRSSAMSGCGLPAIECG